MVPDVDVVWWRLGGPPAGYCTAARVHEVANWHDYQKAFTRVCQVSDGQPVVVISSHRTAAADVVLAPHARVLPVVRHVVNADQVLRVIDPADGALVESTIGDLPWEVLSAVPVWVGISHASSAALRAHAPKARYVTMIHNGVSIPAVVPLRSRPATGRLLVAAVARTVPWKRTDHLVRAVADPRLSTAVRLDVFGEAGSQQAALDELARQLDAPVRFLGYADDLPRRLAGYDLLATASVQEGFGRAVIDAAGAAVPSLVPNAGASPELVFDGLTGMVYDPDDPGDLVAALADALLDRPALARMGSAARVLADAWYTPGRCAAQYLTLVMGQRPASRTLETVQ
ncbi:glycosyltransferase family 4 protein [Streptomyces sp. NBC_01275]|uniref:glycosyltransferase family 4 protein n=1 Tax=Streptomyces sp. NBC_01275 TaxID=2903807 RepID=UPI00224E5495|nr:glycosyltransferase family 4 protein [Streptomyces sp. NBC_01275]MCX4761921.1 glycosyltransferase family 4 protein [Streptomyces sp. NBC_01275]